MPSLQAWYSYDNRGILLDQTTGAIQPLAAFPFATTLKYRFGHAKNWQGNSVALYADDSEAIRSFYSNGVSGTSWIEDTTSIYQSRLNKPGISGLPLGYRSQHYLDYGEQVFCGLLCVMDPKITDT